MAKFAINQTNNTVSIPRNSRRSPVRARNVRVTPAGSTHVLIENSTPLTKTITAYVMAKAEKSSPSQTGLTAQINLLFSSFPNDSYTTRLAKVVEVITGIKPDITSKAPFEFGDVVIHPTTKAKYVILYVNGAYAYGINETGVSYQTFSYPNSGYPAGTKASLAETAIFCRDFLKVNGMSLLAYIGQILGFAASRDLLKTVKFDTAI